MNTPEDSRSPPIKESLAPQELWSVATVAAYLQLARVPASQPTIYRKVAAGSFPQPLRFGAKCTRWRADDVRSWVASAGRMAA
jgi:prophage regulatory protein